MLICLVVAVCNTEVEQYAAGRTFDRAEEVPHNRVALLLGTSPIAPDGHHNHYFDTRIEAAERLFKASKIDSIIVSGGDYRGSEKHGCDEPAAMRDSLVNRGIPSSRIILDYGGTRTLKSIAKAKGVYGLDSLTIISQKYHNERSLYLATHYGIEAVAFNATEPDFAQYRLKNHLRELLARVKLFLDLLIIDRKG